MQSVSLNELADIHLEKARSASAGRSATTVYGDHSHELRQTLIALAQGESLADHESPGEATLQVLVGRVQMTAGDDTWEGIAGDLVPIPSVRHGLQALDDSVFLLTVRAH
ncbi:MAG TPA: cupin domain-containing protein [Marmoricola sp.]|nr:cupin domain-containing protein [Marmoricola sp.]